MYVKALTRYEQTVVDAAVKALTSKGAPLQRINTFLSASIDAACNKNDLRGCFLCNASADYAAHDDDTRALVARGYNKLERALMVPIAELHPTWPQDRVQKTSQLCQSVYAGLRIMSRAAVNRTQLEGARDACLEMLK